MGKKKKEHVTFDEMNKQKKSIPFGAVNNKVMNKGRNNQIVSKSKLGVRGMAK